MCSHVEHDCEPGILWVKVIYQIVTGLFTKVLCPRRKEMPLAQRASSYLSVLELPGNTREIGVWKYLGGSSTVKWAG